MQGTATAILSGVISLVPNGESVSITVNGVQQSATVSGEAFSSTFNTSALTAAGSPYTITYSYAGDANLGAVSNSSETLTVTVAKATPVFSSLSGPSIIQGTATTTLSGTISLVPNGESVSITVNGVQQSATVTGGAFSSTFNTSALTVAGSPYTITYSYAGDANLNAASNASETLTVNVAPPAPVVTGISPAAGPLGGGTSVTITGNDFSGATQVKFGTTAANNVVVDSATQITATSPAGSVGSVNVTVTGPGGTSATVSADQFSYLAMVTGVSPAAGPLPGGTSVTITGTGFTDVTAVDFGTTAATDFHDQLGHADHGHKPGRHGHGGRDRHHALGALRPRRPPISSPI